MFTVHAYLQEEIFGIVTFSMLHFEYVPPDVIVHLPLPRCGILFTCHDFESVVVLGGNPVASFLTERRVVTAVCRHPDKVHCLLLSRSPSHHSPLRFPLARPRSPLTRRRHGAS
jgi:hypothetical protein